MLIPLTMELARFQLSIWDREKWQMGDVWGWNEDHFSSIRLGAPVEQQSVIRTQIPDIWRMGSFLPTLAPAGCVQVSPGTRALLQVPPQLK